MHLIWNIQWNLHLSIVMHDSSIVTLTLLYGKLVLFWLKQKEGGKKSNTILYQCDLACIIGHLNVKRIIAKGVKDWKWHTGVTWRNRVKCELKLRSTTMRSVLFVLWILILMVYAKGHDTVHVTSWQISKGKTSSHAMKARDFKH